MDYKYDSKKHKYFLVPAEHPETVLINSLPFSGGITSLLIFTLFQCGDDLFGKPSNALLSDSIKNTLSDASLFFTIFFYAICVMIYSLQNRMRQEDVEWLESHDV
jgi:preprotein translocase subunit SecG